MDDLTLGEQYLFGSRLRMDVEYLRVAWAVASGNADELTEAIQALEASAAADSLGADAGAIPELMRKLHNYLTSAVSLAGHCMALRNWLDDPCSARRYGELLRESGLADVFPVLKVLRNFASHVRLPVPTMVYDATRIQMGIGDGCSGRMGVDISRLLEGDKPTREQHEALRRIGSVLHLAEFVERWEAAARGFHEGLMQLLEKQYPGEMSRELPGVAPWAIYR